MTYIEDLDPNSTVVALSEALMESFENDMPHWQDSLAYGETIISEDDFPVYDATADESRVSNEDWEAMGEALYRTSDWQ